MTSNKQRSGRLNWRAILALVAVSAVLGGSAFLYVNYLTPEKLAVRSRLNEADSKSEKAIDVRLKPITEVFAKGRKGAKAFAERATSWRGKWELVRGFTNGGESHRNFLSDEYEKLVFSSDELRDAIEASVKGYMDDVEGFESEMLVKLRADLANSERMDDSLPACLRGDEAFRQEYRRLTEQLMAELKAGLCVTVGREAVFWVATTEATALAMQAVQTAGATLGISGGVLGIGASSSVASLGMGLVVAFIIDYLLDKVLQMAGMDPATNIEKLVIESIDKLEAALLRDPGTFSWDRTKGSLRQQLEQLHEARSKLRREAIARFMAEKGDMK
jgi:hypothetical protein